MKYRTGRFYGKDQILELAVVKQVGDFAYKVRFTDAVRGISGVVEVWVFDPNVYEIGRAALVEYDAGRYE